MMTLRLAAFAALALLTACAAPYTVREGTDKFSDPGQPAEFAMVANSVDHRDPLGQTLTNSLDGYVRRDRQTQKVVDVGFNFFRRVTTQELAWTGAPKWIGIRAGDELVVLADGERVTLKALSGRIDHRTSASSIGITTEYFDEARYSATPEQFRQMAFAKQVEFRVNGREASVDFPRYGQRMLESFSPNLQRFYTEQIAPHL